MGNDKDDQALVALGDQSIAGMLGAAVERLGGDGAASVADAIGKLVELRRQEEDRHARRAFFADFADFRAACPQVKRTSTAEMVLKSGARRTQHYADLAEFESTVRPHLYSRGFSWRWDSVPDLEHGTVAVTCTLMHAAGHSESATALVPVDSGSIMNVTQYQGAAYTYGQRYSLAQVLGLVATDDDTDGVPPEKLEPITADEVTNLRQMLEMSGADEKKFLVWARVPSLDKIRAGDYERCVTALQRRLGQ